jgi:membrane dipeptidase
MAAGSIVYIYDLHTKKKMNMARTLLVLSVAFALAACGSGNGSNPTASGDDGLMDRARYLHEQTLTIDTHDDIPFNFASDEVNPCVRGDRQVDVVKMREGGLDVAFFIVYVGQTERNETSYAAAREDALTKFASIRRMAEEMCPDEIELAESTDDVVRIASEGRLVAAIGIENGFVIGKDLSLLEQYHALGARYITLAHGGHNDIADSSTPREDLGDGEAEHDGISAFGEDVIAEMNRLGIMVDVSHVSKAAMLDAARLSRAPVIGSHSSTRALADHPRNMDDEQLLALKENGGVIQMVALGDFVKVASPEKTTAITALGEEIGIRSQAEFMTLSEAEQAAVMERMAQISTQFPGATVSDYVDHIDHAVSLIGIDHVGISSDFDGGGGVEGWNDASETLNVTVELVRRGYSDEEIAKMWSGNLLRVWREVERVAAQTTVAG